jgi:hypothetical protein
VVVVCPAKNEKGIQAGGKSTFKPGQTVLPRRGIGSAQ